MTNRTNAVLIDIELYNAEGTIHQILELAEKGIFKVQRVGDFVRIVFTSHADALIVQQLINEMVDELAPDKVMLAIA